MNVIPDQDQRQLISQTLDSAVTKLHDVVLRHAKDRFDRLVPITTSDDKGYYFMTNPLEPKTVFCSTKEIIGKNGKRSYINGFTLRTPKLSETVNDDGLKDKDNDYASNSDSHDEGQYSAKCNDKQESKILIDRLSAFQKGLIERLKHMMLIPQYNDKKSFNLRINTIKLDNTIKYKNIIEYQNKRNNFSFDIVNQVLMKCRCRLLLKINYLKITNTTTILNIRIVRIMPNDLDNLSMSTRINVISELNYISSRNAEKYNDLNSIPKFKVTSKAEVKKDLMRLFNTSIVSTNRSRINR